MSEWGIFNDEASAFTEDEAIEAGFASEQEAQKALEERYKDDDSASVHMIEEDDDDEDDDECEDEDEDNYDYEDDEDD